MALLEDIHCWLSDSVFAVWAREALKKGCQPAFHRPGWTDGLEGLGITSLRGARYSIWESERERT